MAPVLADITRIPRRELSDTDVNLSAAPCFDQLSGRGFLARIARLGAEVETQFRPLFEPDSAGRFVGIVSRKRATASA